MAIRRCRRDWSLFSVAALLSTSAAWAAEHPNSTVPDEMLVVYASVIFRHGQRSRLVKSLASEFGENAGVTLTPEGEQQCYDLGRSLRYRYVEPPANESISTIIEGIEEYDSDRVQITSTGYDRTLISAQALALGLYPTTDDSLLPGEHNIIPIHTSDPANDAELLASNLCPVYTDNWQEFYRTTEFESKQDAASQFIEDLYWKFEEYKTTSTPVCMDEVIELYQNKLQFHAPYNLWDCVMVLRNEGDETAFNLINVVEPEGEGEGMTGFEYLEYLTFWIEDQKYEPQLTGRMLGGLYVANMMTRFEQVIENLSHGRADTAGRYPGLHITAAHYPTLKGIAGCLSTGGMNGIPDPTSHLTFELLQNTSADASKGEEEFGVRILYQEGTDNSTLTTLQLGMIFDPEGTYDLDPGEEYYLRDSDIMPWGRWSYVLEHLVDGGPAYYIGGEPEWCEDCVNLRVDTCALLALDDVTERWQRAVAATQDPIAETTSDRVAPHGVALLSLLGVVLGVVAGIYVRPCLDRRSSRRNKDVELSVAGNRGLETWGVRPTSNGAFRLGGKSRTPTRHVMVGGRTAMGVHTAADMDDSLEGDEGDMEGGDGSRIPAFSASSPLGTPVPFPRGEATRKVKVAPSPVGDEEGGGGFANGVSPTTKDYGFSGAEAQPTEVDWEADEGGEEQWNAEDSKAAPSS